MKQNYWKRNWLFSIQPLKKNEDFTFYDYVGHLEKFGYEWSKGGFKYKITINDNKIIKKLTLEKQQRIDFNVDESRMYNIANANDSFFNILISFSMPYFENVNFLKRHFKISGKKFDFTRLSILKNIFIWVIILPFNIKINLTFEGLMIYIVFFRPILSS